MANSEICLQNIEQQQTNGLKPYQKSLWGPRIGPKARQGEFCSSGQLSITGLKTDILRPDNDAEVNSTDNSKKQNGQKQIFWQTFIEDRRPQLRILGNYIDIEVMVNIASHITNISPKSWTSNWLLQDIYVQFQGVGIL